MPAWVVHFQEWTGLVSDAPTGVPGHRDFREYPCNGGRGVALEAGMSCILGRRGGRTSWSRPRLQRRSYAIAANVTQVINVAGGCTPAVAGLGAIRGLNFWAGTIPGFVRMVVDALLNGLCGMDWADYLRDQATMYRQLAEQTDHPAVHNEMLELASVCEEVANNVEDHLTGG